MRWILAAVIIIIITPGALAGFWFSVGDLGISDWDYYFSYHEVVRNMVLAGDYIPQWNPYICGGTAAIGDPEFPLLTPTFLLELIFGVPIGLRLSIFAMTIFGGLGMLWLAKRLGFSAFAGLLAAVAFAFGSVNILEIVEGHPNVFSAYYVPWVLLAWLTAYRSKKFSWLIFLAVLLALMFMQGGIYMLMYMAGAFVFLIAVVRNKKQALEITAAAGVIALGLAAIKIIPVLFWLSQFQDVVYASSALTLPYLKEIFLGRNLHGAQVIPNQGGGWHEYGAYIGPLILALAALAIFKIKNSRLIRSLFLAALIATLISSTGPILKPLFDQAPWLPRSNISRLILFAVIPLSLLAGAGLDLIKAQVSKLRLRFSFEIIAISLLVLVTLDLTTLSAELSRQAFVLPQPVDPPAENSGPPAYTIRTHKIRRAGIDYTRSYTETKAGYGTLSYCAVLGPRTSVVTENDPEKDIKFVSIKDDSSATTELISWTPNQTLAQVNLSNNADVVLNNNYAKGWLVNGQPAKEIDGRVGASFPPGQHEVTFKYQARGFIVGLVISVIALLSLIVWPIYRRLRR